MKVLLPNSVENNVLRARLDEDCLSLQVQDTWPKRMVYVILVNQLWMQVEEGHKVSTHHPKIGGSHLFLRKLQFGMNEQV